MKKSYTHSSLFVETPKKEFADHNVSEKTIRRDALFAKAIDKIGEVNPELKKEILSGKSKINKSQIQELAKMEKLPVLENIEDLENIFQNPKTSVLEEVKDDLEVKRKNVIQLLKDKKITLEALEQIEKICLELATKK